MLCRILFPSMRTDIARSNDHLKTASGNRRKTSLKFCKYPWTETTSKWCRRSSAPLLWTDRRVVTLSIGANNLYNLYGWTSYMWNKRLPSSHNFLLLGTSAKCKKESYNKQSIVIGTLETSYNASPTISLKKYQWHEIDSNFITTTAMPVLLIFKRQNISAVGMLAPS